MKIWRSLFDLEASEVSSLERVKSANGPAQYKSGPALDKSLFTKYISYRIKYSSKIVKLWSQVLAPSANPVGEPDCSVHEAYICKRYSNLCFFCSVTERAKSLFLRRPWSHDLASTRTLPRYCVFGWDTLRWANALSKNSKKFTGLLDHWKVFTCADFFNRGCLAGHGL